MKIIRLLFPSVVGLILAYCVTVNYFQVFKAVPVGESVVLDDAVVFENDQCRILYNFWKEGGDIGFRFENKMDDEIYIDLNESYFVLNGVARRYFQNRVFTYGTDRALQRSRGFAPQKASFAGDASPSLHSYRITPSMFSSEMTASGYSVAFTEEELVCVPGKTMVPVSEFSISQNVIRDCDLLRFPLRSKDVKTKNYTRENSPLVFSNRIVYYPGKSGLPVNVENKFYVSSVTNYNDKQMVEYKYEEFCGQKSPNKKVAFRHEGPDRFFVKYMKTPDSMRR